MNINETLAKEFNITVDQVEKTVALIDEGNTIPFISRYRKEVTGSLDDTVLRDLFDRLTYLRKLEERREEISSLIEAQEKLTPEITLALQASTSPVELVPSSRSVPQEPLSQEVRDLSLLPII